MMLFVNIPNKNNSRTCAAMLSHLSHIQFIGLRSLSSSRDDDVKFSSSMNSRLRISLSMFVGYTKIAYCIIRIWCGSVVLLLALMLKGTDDDDVIIVYRNFVRSCSAVYYVTHTVFFLRDFYFPLSPNACHVPNKPHDKYAILTLH